MTEKNHYFENYDGIKIDLARGWKGHKFFGCSFNHATIVIDPDYPEFPLHGAAWHGCSARFLEAQGIAFNHFTADNCDFQQSNFKDSSWYQSPVSKSDFTWATFEGAKIRGLRGYQNEFRISRVQFAKDLNPYDRDAVAEVIRSEAGDDTEMLMIAALVKNSMELCWSDWRMIGQMPKWRRVAEVVTRTLSKYPWFSELLGDHVEGIPDGNTSLVSTHCCGRIYRPEGGGRCCDGAEGPASIER